MMLGNLCTRRCGFCAVPKGRPEPIDLDEPRRVAEAVAALGLRARRHHQRESRRRSGGRGARFAMVIEEIRRQAPGCRVEVLIPDFQGDREAIRIVVEARPEVLNHNTETVPRLYRVVRSGARYERTLELLRYAKELNPGGVTKSGVMVGLGEETHELLEVFRDLAAVGCDILTIGQYLRPSRDHLPMARLYTPREFAELKSGSAEDGLPPRGVGAAGAVQLSRARAGGGGQRTLARDLKVRASPGRGFRARERIHGNDSDDETAGEGQPRPPGPVHRDLTASLWGGLRSPR